MMKFILASVSALAMVATPVFAQGNGNGNGNRGGGQQAQGDNRGGGNGNGQAERGNRGNGQAEARNRGNGQAEARDRGNGQDRVERPERGNRGNGNAEARNRGNGQLDRGPSARRDSRGNGNGNGNRAVRTGGPNFANPNSNRRSAYDRNYRDWDRDRDGGFFETVLLGNRTGIIDGCPPGLARKNPPCVPPGQARQRGDWDRYDERYSRYSPNWWGLPYDRGNYFYEDGFLLRYDGNRVAGYIPLLGGALSVGNQWPSNYGYRSMPDYYSAYYGFGNNYRYADNVVYRLDPETAAITSIAALLTGEDFVVGQPMPRGYDVYNVPYSYRDRYYDTPEANYRYNNGYVYEIDPTTMLVASAIELIL